ncbi:hypothetical protein [Stenoxybacter acetivorans]|uniref:hypothetical protein n=1 Tax=Stenoxybacter acetivorans TaxID=422441 RepID=UPI000561E927|nr:hypothetical protein [Stenoxybacter acetivorans]
MSVKNKKVSRRNCKKLCDDTVNWFDNQTAIGEGGNVLENLVRDEKENGLAVNSLLSRANLLGY